MTSTAEPLEEQYFVWLYNHYVGYVLSDPATHNSLCAYLQQISYEWSVPNDDNRAEDGKFLREKFLSEHQDLRGELSHDFLTQECSVFEFLVALSERAEFESLETQVWWFWEMIDNLGLSRFNDNSFGEFAVRTIDRRIDVLLNRRFRPNGDGGLFPLQNPPVDQRTAEVWYQLSSYILEMS